MARPPLPGADVRGRWRSRSAPSTRSSRTRCRCGTRWTGSSTPCAASCTTCGPASPSSPSSCARSRTSAIALAGCLADRLSGRVLPRAVRAAHEDAPARAADRPVLGQLPDAHAGVGRAAAPGRARQPRRSIDLGIISQPYGWLDGQASSVIFALIYGYVPYLILPLYATLDRIEPHVLEAGRDLGASPTADVHPRHSAAQPLRDPGGERADRAADVRRLLHERRHLGLAAHDHDRQRDQPLLPGRAAAHGRCMSRDRALGGARGR